MRTAVSWFLALTLIAIVGTGCGGGKKSATEIKQAGVGQEERAFSLPDELPSSLLPTLVVGADSCYVFLQPDGNSQFFGPLLQGETVKRLESHKSWIRVWIPRLKISGWVRDYQVYPSTEKSADQGAVPGEYLTTVSIARKRVNIRESATLQAPVVYLAEQGQEFLLCDENEGWYQVWVPHLERRAWVSAKVAVKQNKR